MYLTVLVPFDRRTKLSVVCASALCNDKTKARLRTHCWSQVQFAQSEDHAWMSCFQVLRDTCRFLGCLFHKNVFTSTTSDGLYLLYSLSAKFTELYIPSCTNTLIF